MLQDFYRAQPKNVALQHPPNGSPTTWTPPLPPLFKVNYDGTMFKETREAGIGVVIRDSAVVEVEALAARQAIKFAKELNLQSIILEGDSELITRALQQEGPSFSCYGQLIEETQALAGLFPSYSVSHVHRKGNSLTHNLARNARHVSGLVV
nr:uncharacterized protein LOC112040778 [Quercus suber]